MTPLLLDGAPLDIHAVAAVARDSRAVALGPQAVARLVRGRAGVDATIAAGRSVYGINTGFGSLSTQRIAPADLRELQRNLVRSHAAGVDAPLPVPVVRGMMLLAAASLAHGLSGVRPAVVEHLVALLNAGVTPVVPSVGSVGASGDLAPLAHVALVLIGEGEASFGRDRLTGAEALRRATLAPLTLEAKEGLALVNGTHLMAARAALVLDELATLLPAAVLACAMSIDASRATDRFLDERALIARNHPGPLRVGRAMRTALQGSAIVRSHREHDPRVQDPYSLRCAPHVIGAALDAVEYVRAAATAELGAVTDNPLVFGEGDVVSAGNFHGMPIALPLDVLAIAVTHVAGIAERRIFHLLSAHDPQSELPPYLSRRPGLYSGMMLAQYTAAACCNECIGLTVPASVSNLPTSAGMEDYNSFGPRSASKAARVVELARLVVAAELMCAAEGLDAHRPLRSGEIVEGAYARVRELVPPLEADRPLGPDITTLSDAILAGRFSMLAV